MAGGIPVRLSEALTVQARTAAETQDRSLTEQVEHWARLGQAVEYVVMSRTVERLKARSHDPALAKRLAAAGSVEGQAKAAEFIRQRNAVLYGIGSGGKLVKVRGRRKTSK